MVCKQTTAGQREHKTASDKNKSHQKCLAKQEPSTQNKVSFRCGRTNGRIQNNETDWLKVEGRRSKTRNSALSRPSIQLFNCENLLQKCKSLIFYRRRMGLACKLPSAGRDGGRLHHAAHSAHVRHAAATSLGRFVSYHRLSGNQQSRNRCGIFKCNPNDFGRVDDTGLQHIAVFL
jgi:hypothetical protein